ncbi:hypothetical protein C8A05DRAFT_16501 [Staphylotrichum tortipilum]|uniref:Protein kinase domain-containing protein n=1 Tax=Staphylotrichum tortipilum TaxID=2831512 RepID=A0AAN6MJF6_9PEZI|nr:hypothetical protein C8A05DRAFT_16501 [Staphylotrichum longicolle]
MSIVGLHRRVPFDKFLNLQLGRNDQGWIQAAFPEWFLPDCVIMKMRKSGEDEILDEYLDTELKAYRLMKPIQGLVIPKFFGLVRYKGQRVIILEHLHGVSASSPEGAMRLEELAALLLPCYRALHQFRVQYEDPNLSNFVLVGGRFMVLDLESAVFDSSDRDLDTRGQEPYGGGEQVGHGRWMKLEAEHMRVEVGKP